MTVIIGENNAALATKEVRVPIRDWIPCTDDWSGTIKYLRHKPHSVVVQSRRQDNGNGSGSGIRYGLWWEIAKIKLNPRKPEEMKTKPQNPADMDIGYRYLNVFEGTRENDPCCGKTEGSFTTKFRRGTDQNFRGMLKRPFNLSYQGGERDFSLSFSFSTGMFDLSVKDIDEVTDTNCILEELGNLKNPPEDKKASIEARLEDGRYGQRFVGTAGEVLFGKKEIKMEDGATLIWEWNLYRCRD